MTNHGAIRTRYIGPTDTRSSRISVTYNGVITTVPYNSGADDSHAYAAAQVLAVPLSQLVYRDDWKIGKYFDLLEAPPKEHEFEYYVVTLTHMIAGFNSLMLAEYFIESFTNDDMQELPAAVITRSQIDNYKPF